MSQFDAIRLLRPKRFASPGTAGIIVSGWDIDDSARDAI